MLIFISYKCICRNIFTVKFLLLKSGFGLIVSTIIRKILLSLLKGFSIVLISISNILHEYCYVDYIIDDLLEVSLNFSRVNLFLNNCSSLVIRLLIKGIISLYAKDLFINNLCFIGNPNLRLLTFKKYHNTIITILINKDNNLTKNNLELINWYKFNNYILLNPNFSPIKSVSYKIVNYNSFDWIFFLIKTNGLISFYNIINSIFSFFNKNLVFKSVFLGKLLLFSCNCVINYLFLYSLINFFPLYLIKYINVTKYYNLGSILYIRNNFLYTGIILNKSLYLYLKFILIQLKIISNDN